MTDPQLVATAWTSAGDTSPRRIPSTSPVPIAERVAAVADAGYVGMGLIADDLLVIRDSIGFGATSRPDRRCRAHSRRGRTDRALVDSSRRGGPHLRCSRPAVRGGRRPVAHVHQDRLRTGARTPTSARRWSSRFASSPSRQPTTGRGVAIETMPFSIIATVPMGAEIVAAADHPAVGLLVDAWHVFRAGTSLEELAMLADARDDLRRRARRRRCRGRRHAVRGHRRAPAAVRRRMFRPPRVGRGCCATTVSTARGAWRSCRRRSGRCPFARRCVGRGVGAQAALTSLVGPHRADAKRVAGGIDQHSPIVRRRMLRGVGGTQRDRRGHRGRRVVDADVEVHLLKLRPVGPRRGGIGFRSHQRQHRSRAGQCHHCRGSGQSIEMDPRKPTRVGMRPPSSAPSRPDERARSVDKFRRVGVQTRTLAER